MSIHLDKARAALEAASALDVDAGDDLPPRAYTRLLDIALVQAQVAQADALERLVHLVDARVGMR